VAIVGAGAGILNVPDVAPVSPELVKPIVAPVTDDTLVAVRLVNVAKPPEAVTDEVPPRVHVPDPTAAATLAELFVVTVLPYWSCTATIGCVANASPLPEGAAGCWVSPIFVATPAVNIWDTVAAEYPVAFTVMV